jgi:hypothetical protein
VNGGRFAAILAAAALVVVPGAAAKDFDPGDVRLCNRERCVPIAKPAVLPLLSRFYYWRGHPAIARPVALGAPAFELRFRNGYATGIVATGRLDRFLSYGVHLERFQAGVWYVMPTPLADELRRLARGLRPLRVTRAALDRSR